MDFCTLTIDGLGIGDRDLLELFGQEATGIGRSSKASIKRALDMAQAHKMSKFYAEKVA